MPSFNYRAVNAKGEPQSGTLDASDRRALTQRLRAMGLRPVEITTKGGASAGTIVAAGTGAKDAAQAASMNLSTEVKPTGPLKVLSPEEFKGFKTSTAFLKKLFQLHAGGMPLGDSIRLLSIRITEPKQASLANRLWKDISEGRTLANALRQYPKSFDNAMINLVEAGESTGNLVPVLDNLINHLEESAELKKKVYGGLAYPIFICTLAFGVLLLFLYFLLPRIETMMKGMGSGMPFLTQLLIDTANFAVHWGIFLVIGVVLISAGVASWRRTPPGRAATDSFLLRLPVLKYIFSNIDICRVSNLCATLLESGLNTTETLRMTERSIGNVVFQSRFSAARSLINDGASFSNAFKRFQVLPDLDLDLLSVGENTGNVSKSFREIYKTHSRQLSEQFHLLTIMITGGALGLAFSLVTILALGIVSAVMNMAKAISSH